MICQQCLRRLARRTADAPPPPRPLRQWTTTAAAAPRRPFSHRAPSRQEAISSTPTATATNARPNDVPAATSTSAAQPFSTPLAPRPTSTSVMAAAAVAAATAAAPRAPSSVPAGTVLKGLNFVKNKQDPVALEDHEYPAWLWDVLSAKPAEGESGSTESEGDLFAKSKKQRRLAAKALRKRQLLHPEMLAPKVPVYQQSVDLPRGDGTVQGAKQAGDARQQLTKAMRNQRRSKIKEDNFLKQMR